MQEHGVQLGEEDWVHLSAPLFLGDCSDARLCMSRNPETGEQDGPVVVVGNIEYSLEAAAALGSAIIDITRVGLTTAS